VIGCNKDSRRGRGVTCWRGACRINNAGSNAYSYGPLANATDADLISIVETNVLGVMLCCREVRRTRCPQQSDGPALQRTVPQPKARCLPPAGYQTHEVSAGWRAHFPHGRCRGRRQRDPAVRSLRCQQARACAAPEEPAGGYVSSVLMQHCSHSPVRRSTNMGSHRRQS